MTLLAVPLVAVQAQGGGGAGGGGGFGQGRRFGGGMRGGGLFLLRDEKVQAELKMTPDQIAKIDTKQTETRQKMQELMQSAGDFQSMSPEDRAKLMQKGQELNDAAVKDILTADQLPRFHQLELQQMGPQALTRKDVAEKLKITDDQKAKIRDIQTQSMADIRQAMQDQDRQKMGEIRRATAEKILAVLTDDQRAQFKDMLGAKFEFSPPRRPGGGPGGPGGPPPAPGTR
jgi:hypothetical protein